MSEADVGPGSRFYREARTTNVREAAGVKGKGSQSGEDRWIVAYERGEAIMIEIDGSFRVVLDAAAGWHFHGQLMDILEQVQRRIEAKAKAKTPEVDKPEATR